MEISATLSFWFIRAAGLGLAVLGLLTWNGSSALAGWRLFALGAPHRMTLAPIALRSGQGGTKR